MEFKNCEEYVIKKLLATEQELDEIQRLHLELKAEHQKTLEIIDIIKKNAKVQYNTIWIHLHDVDNKQEILDILELKEEATNEQSNINW